MGYRHISLVCFCLLSGYFSHTIYTNAWLTLDDICKTPDNQNGHCLPDNMCISMKNWKKGKVLSNEEEQALKKYSCGSDLSSAKVCCPNGTFTLDWLQGDGKTSVEIDTRTKNHSDHRNIQLLPKNCGVNDIDSKIIGGKEAALNEFPWVAALKYKTGDQIEINCGGSLINSRYVLTAAHCIGASLVGVRLGEHNLTSAIDCALDDFGVKYCSPLPQDFVISKADATIHEEYNSINLNNDIALIRLREDADMSKKSVGPICLPITTQEKDVSAIRGYTVIGWGRTATFEEKSKVLLKTNVYKQDISKCQGDQSTNTKKLCVGGRDEKDACKGDSGSPLSSEYIENRNLKTIQYGIVSSGSNIICGKENAPTMYTNIPAFVEWILNNLRP